jgi:hypothetical protein
VVLVITTRSSGTRVRCGSKAARTVLPRTDPCPSVASTPSIRLSAPSTSLSISTSI